ARHDTAVLRFDFTGLGTSGGKFGDTSFSSNIDDLLAAAEFMRTKYRAPAIVIGHSLGGAAVLATASRIPEARAIAPLGAPFEPKHVSHLIQGGEKELAEKGEAEVRIGGRPFRIGKQFLEDL